MLNELSLLILFMVEGGSANMRLLDVDVGGTFSG